MAESGRGCFLVGESSSSFVRISPQVLLLDIHGTPVERGRGLVCSRIWEARRPEPRLDVEEIQLALLPSSPSRLSFTSSLPNHFSTGSDRTSFLHPPGSNTRHLPFPRNILPSLFKRSNSPFRFDRSDGSSLPLSLSLSLSI